jgi:hypothetical protein
LNTNQLTNQPAYRPTNLATNQPTNQPANQPNNHPNAAPTQRLLALEPTFLNQHTVGSPGAAKAASVLRTNAFLLGHRNREKGAETADHDMLPSTKCCTSIAFASPGATIPAPAQVW